MPNDIYGFGEALSLESFDNTGNLEGAEAATNLTELMQIGNSIEQLRTQIVAEGVSREDALTLESLQPGILPQIAPVRSYTQVRTQTNLKVTLESIKSWVTMSLTNIVKALYRFLVSCVNWIRNLLKGLFRGGKDTKRVIANTKKTVEAADEIVTATRADTGPATDEALHKAFEKAKLKVSDHYTHLMKRLVSGQGTEEMVRHLRSQIHTAYAKLDVLTEKYTHGLDIADKGDINFHEANNLFADIAGLNPATLLELSVELGFFEQRQKFGQLDGPQVVDLLWDHLKQLSGKRASWDVKTSDTLGGFINLTVRLEALADAILDEDLDDSLPTIKDFTNKARKAPEALTANLSLASERLTQGFTVAQHGIGIYVEILKALLALTDLAWQAAKGLMGDVATRTKSDCKDQVAVITDIEKRLKATLERA